MDPRTAQGRNPLTKGMSHSEVTPLPPHSFFPPPPSYSAIDDELFLYGGLDKEGSFSCADGLYVFKTSSLTWERCDTTGDAPRALSVSASVHGHRLTLFGGVLDGEARNDIHILDTSESPHVMSAAALLIVSSSYAGLDST